MVALLATKFVICGLVAIAHAGILQLPLQVQHDIDDSVLPSGNVPLGRPVKSFQNLFYKANISIGTPPQTFNVALDTTAEELFVPSATCEEACAHHPNRTYNSSESTTYLEHGDRASSKWAGMSFSGTLSYDTIHLGGNNVSDFLFEEWTSASCNSIGCFGFGYDGVLGLAPPWSAHQKHGRNLLSMLLSQKTLDKPIFSLKLPTRLDEEGEILFGAVNSKLSNSDLIDLPVVKMTAPPFSSNWIVPASHISFASSKPLEVTLPNKAIAALNSGSPYLMLPDALAQNLTAAIGAEAGPAWFHHIPCERRQELPLLTFTLDGHDFSISAFEYTLKIDHPQFPKTCITTFMSTKDFALPDLDVIVLGSPFLRGFYSVWNFQEGKVGLANLN